MLSPNARKRAACNCGVACTATLKPHDATWLDASRAWQATLVLPTANWVPDCGVQVVVTGAAPPDVCG